MTWAVEPMKLPDRTQHVLPVGDVVQHDKTLNCTCGPRVEGIWCADGVAALIVIHMALDGRESFRDFCGGQS